MSVQNVPSQVDTPNASLTRWFDWLAFLILFIALQVSAYQLISTQWVDDLYITWNIVVLGLLLGLALGFSRFSSTTVTVLAFLYGIIVVAWQIGLLLGANIPWNERFVSIVGHLDLTFDQLANGQAVTSPLLFLVIVEGGAWGLSLFASYTLVRYGRPWRAMLPSGLAMLVIANYGVRDALHAGLLGIYLFLTLLLVARYTFLKRNMNWRGQRAIMPADIGYNLMIVTLISATFLVALAWSAPIIGQSMPSMGKTWEQATASLNGVRLRISKAFAPLNTSIGLVQMNAIVDYYGDSLPLGQGNPLSDEVILRIEAPEPPSSISRYYWIGRSYDYYSDGQWKSTLTEYVFLTPDRYDLDLPEYQGRWETFVRFTPQVPVATIITPSYPKWVSRPVEIQMARNPDGTVDITAIRATPPLATDDEYEVLGSLDDITIAELRSASRDYPAWITDRYLQLPSEITPRTFDLANRIASDMDNPYDIAIAITKYLRSNIKYVEQVPERPRHQDAVDWMLFDQRQGFCNYYASAEVIMLRSLGIPARLSAGYAQGEVLSESASNVGFSQAYRLGEGVKESENSGVETFLVRQRDAHAWPEVYFPEYGWVIFEPTASQPSLIRRPGEGELANGIFADRPPENRGSDIQFDRPHPLIDSEFESLQRSLEFAPELNIYLKIINLILMTGYFLVLIDIGYMLWMTYSHIPVKYIASLQQRGINLPGFLQLWLIGLSLPPVVKDYYKLNQALIRLGYHPLPATTPTERAATLEHFIPEAKKPAEVVVAEYNALIYSQRPANHVLTAKASREIIILSYKALLKRAVNFIARSFS